MISSRSLLWALGLVVLVQLASPWTLRHSFFNLHAPAGVWTSRYARTEGMKMSLNDLALTTSFKTQADVKKYLVDASQSKRQGGGSKAWGCIDKEVRLELQSALVNILAAGDADAEAAHTAGGEGSQSLRHRNNRKAREEEEEKFKFLSEVVYLLGKLGASVRSSSTHNFDAGCVDAIWAFVADARTGAARKYIGKTLYGIASMGVRWQDIPTRPRKMVVTALTQQVDAMNELAVVNLVYSMGKMGAGWSQLPVQTRIRICVNVQRVSPIMDSRAVANVFWGLGRSKAQWGVVTTPTTPTTSHNLPGSLQLCLAQRLQETSPFGAQALSSTLHGLKQSSARWRQLSPGLRAVILSNLGPSLKAGATEQAVATIIGSLGSLGFHHQELSEDNLEALSAALLRVAPYMTKEGISSVFNGLAKMRYTAEALPQAVVLSLEVALQRVVELSAGKKKTADSARFTANIMWSLGQLHMVWPHARGGGAYNNAVMMNDGGGGGGDYQVPYPSKKRVALKMRTAELLSLSLIENAALMNEQGTFSTLSGLAKMGAEWSRLGAPLTQALTTSLLANVPSMRPEAVCTTLWALGSVGLTWDGISTSTIADRISISNTNELLDTMVNATIRVAGALNTKGTSIALYSLAVLECRYDALPHALRAGLQNAFLRNSDKASAREVAIMLYSFGRMNAGITSKKARAAMLAALERTVEDMDEQNLGNAIWGLFGKLDLIAYVHAPPSLQCKVSRAIVGKQDSLNEKSVLSILHGFSSRLGVQSWVHLGGELQSCLLSTTARVFAAHANGCTLGGMGGQQQQHTSSFSLAGNVLYAFGRLGVPWGVGEGTTTTTTLLSRGEGEGEVEAVCMTEALQNALLDSLVHSQDTNPSSSSPPPPPPPAAAAAAAAAASSWERSRAISFGLNGLAQLSTWAVLTPLQQGLVLEAVHTALPSLAGSSPADLANVMWSLGRLGVPMDALTGNSDEKGEARAVLLAAVREAAAEMRPFELVWTLWALNRMGVRFPSPCVDASIDTDDGSGDDVAAAAAATATMTGLLDTLVSVAAGALPLMSREEMGVMMFAMTAMRVDINSEPGLVEGIFKKLHA